MWGKPELGKEIKIKVQSHSYKNKLFGGTFKKNFGIFPLSEDKTKLARNLSALVKGVLEQEAL